MIDIWTPAAYALSPYAVPVFATALAVLGLGMIVVIRERASQLGVLFFLVTVVLQDGAQLRVLARARTLRVPVDGFQLFHQRNDGPVHVARCCRQLIQRLVITNTGHCFLLMNSGIYSEK